MPPVRDGFFDRSLGFVGRTLAAFLLLGLFVAGAAAIAALRPAWTQDVQGVLGRQAALSFATGLIANVLMLAVIGFLFITICLRPPGLLLAVGMLAFNVAGMAAVGAEIGSRLSERMSGQWTPTSRTALGVAVPGAIIGFLWAIGGCFGFFGSMGALLLGSFGVGAILVKTLNLGAQAPTPAPQTAPDGGPGRANETNVAQPPATAAPVPTPATDGSAAVEPAASEPAASEVQTSASGTTSEQWWAAPAPNRLILRCGAAVGRYRGGRLTRIEGDSPEACGPAAACGEHSHVCRFSGGAAGNAGRDPRLDGRAAAAAADPRAGHRTGGTDGVRRALPAGRRRSQGWRAQPLSTRGEAKPSPPRYSAGTPVGRR